MQKRLLALVCVILFIVIAAPGAVAPRVAPVFELKVLGTRVRVAYLIGHYENVVTAGHHVKDLVNRRFVRRGLASAQRLLDDLRFDLQRSGGAQGIGAHVDKDHQRYAGKQRWQRWSKRARGSHCVGQ